MKTTEQLVQEIADREAIRDLCDRYCDCIWRKDIDGLVKLFAEDGTFKVEGVEVEAISRGRRQLKKMYEKSIEKINPRPLVHSRIVDLLDSARATGRCYVEVFSANVGMERLGFGYYEDEYSRVKDTWKFASRRFSLDVIDTTVSLRETFMV